MLPCQSAPTASYCWIVVSPPFSPDLTLFEEHDQVLLSLQLQAQACQAMGSQMYARLFLDLSADYQDNGRTFALLAGRSQRPIHDALPLRLAGALHRIVLQGKDDRLARHYPSVGGKPGQDFTVDVIGNMRDHLDEIDIALTQQVQTNEVGRSVVHLSLLHWLTSLDIYDVDLLEIGASAGLNLNCDRYYACSNQLRMGNASSPIRMMGDWFTHTPTIPSTAAVIHRRRGSDISPIDVSEPDSAMRLLSFVWPDQKERFARTKAAIEIAQVHRPIVDSASADTWIHDQLARPRERATLIFHSIVWQYLGTTVQKNLTRAIAEAGKDATPSTPIIWARMEPDGPHADVQVDIWNGQDQPHQYRVAQVGYHGYGLNWLV